MVAALTLVIREVQFPVLLPNASRWRALHLLVWGDGTMTTTHEHTWVRRGRRLVGAAVLVAVLLPIQGGVGERSVTAAHGSCQTPFLVYTDPANPGMQSQSGDIAVTRD